MKSIYLKKLKLKNFKGIKSLEINLENNLNNILGDNGTGKTTIFDGFTWLLFGKDHNDNAKFEIKTLDHNNKAIPKLEHEVEAILLIDGEEISIKRVYKEKWVKQKGRSEAVLTGHTTSFFYNNVPLTLKEFNGKINSIIDEKMFKLLTNPFYFNSLPWLSRREILTNIAEVISDAEIASKNEKFVKILEEASNKSLEEFKREIASSKKRIKNELEEIPTRIDEIYTSLPKEQDWKSIEKEILDKNSEIEKVVQQIIDLSKVDEATVSKLKNKQHLLDSLEQDRIRIEGNARNHINVQDSEYRNMVNNHKTKIQTAEHEVQKIERNLEYNVSDRRSIEEKLSKLRVEFANKQEEEIKLDANSFTCPTCKRDFEPHKIAEMQEEMKANFNSKKAIDLENINSTGKELKQKFEKVSERVKDMEVDLEKAKNEVEKLKKEFLQIDVKPNLILEEVLAENTDYENCLKSIEAVKQEILEIRNSEAKPDVELLKSLENDRTTLKNEVDIMTKTLYQKEQIESGKNRIKTLEDNSKLLGQKLADLEKKEFTIDQFFTVKMNTIEMAVNKLFPTVKFKMFCEQLNGGIADCCETLINGVPFDNANNASKIIAGIEIINVLAEQYDFNAPIFIDNAESIVRLPYSKSQLIRLVVSENHKSLTIN